MTTESSSDLAIAQTGMDQELVESHIREAYWLADTGDIAALEAHLAEMNNEEIVELLAVVFEDRLTSIWKAIPEERQLELSGQLEPAAIEVISSDYDSPPEATLLKTLLELSALDASEEIQQTVADRDINDLADVLEAMPAPARSKIWNSIPEERRAEVLTLLDEGVRNSLLSKLDEGEVLPLVAELTTSELADVMDAVHEDVADAILRSLPEAEREDMEKVLSYEDDSAGRWMESEWIAIRADVALDVVARYLKRLGRMPPHTDGLMVIDREGHYLGKLPVSALLTQDEALGVEEVMEKDVDWTRLPSSGFSSVVRSALLLLLMVNTNSSAGSPLTTFSMSCGKKQKPHCYTWQVLKRAKICLHPYSHHRVAGCSGWASTWQQPSWHPMSSDFSSPRWSGSLRWLYLCLSLPAWAVLQAARH